MMALNNLLASPSFEAWREGEPLDVERMLRADDGRPRLSIVSTAHLSDEERLFVTALLLDKVKTWMRRQGGTTQLRALVYMDEIFGYFPPHPANPPTKRPLLTLLKQARAQGVGVVLATQNPVDLDYKGLANMGTWLVGTLQTEQDRDAARERPAGRGARGEGRREAPRGDEEARLPPPRRAPQGPVPRPVALGDVVPARPADAGGDLAAHDGERRRPAAPPRARPPAAPGGPPVLPPPFRHLYLERRGADVADALRAGEVRGALQGRGRDGGRAGVAARPGPRPPTRSRRSRSTWTRRRWGPRPRRPCATSTCPGWLASAGAKGVEKALRDRLDDKLARDRVLRDPVTKAASRPGETREAFAARVGEGDGGATAEKLRQKLEKKKADLAVREQEVAGRKQEKWLAIGSAVLRNIGLLTGRRRSVSGVGAVLSKNRMEGTAEARAEALRAEVADLERQLAEATEVDPARLVEETLAPVRGGVEILRYEIVWVY